MIKHVSLDKLAGTSVGRYYLERFMGQSKLGPSFLAHTDPTTTYLLRFLEGPMYATPKEREAYLEHFHYQAGQIAALKHPYILPLVDFGVFRGLPYLVTPHIPLRSLRTRIDKNGVLNTFTAGRYLDQIATALEYAHEHGVLHGGLSVDTIFIRLDGQLVVTDVGVRSLLEMNSQDKPRNQLLRWGEGYAPEQLLGKPPHPSTDVYALGAVIYHLLTGSSVFAGSTHDEIAQQHLYASVPSLTQRSDLPVGLYSILAHALAKDPVQRFHQPGAFANAYHSAIGPTNRTRLPFVVSEAASMQSLQPLVTGTSTADTQFAEHVRSNNQSVGTEHTAGGTRSTPQPPIAYSLHGFTDEKLVPPLTNPPPVVLYS
ncbi:MAG: serine/threonine-protein kinase [Ktedonobacteraceae bacterium]